MWRHRVESKPNINMSLECELRSLTTVTIDAIKLQLARAFDILTLSDTFLCGELTQDLIIDGFYPSFRKDRDTHG